MDARDHVKKTDAKIPICEPCTSCGVRCCNRFAVPLTGSDLVRMLKKVDAPIDEFCELASAQKIENAPHSYVFIFENKKLEEKLLTLKRRKNMYCIFSMHSNGCTVWGAHPMVCRAYPFVAKEGGGIKVAKNFVCPRQWKAGEFEEGQIVEIVKKMDEEIFEYNKIVRKWNAEFARKKDEKEFWKYLIKESERILKEKN